MTAVLSRHPFTDLWHPGVLLFTVALQAAYLLAIGPLQRRYGWGPAPSIARQVSFLLGLSLIYLSEGTPLHVLAETYLFSAHMLQHTVLTMILPPLVLMGLPDWIVRPLFRAPVLGAILRGLSRPLPALLVFNLVYSLWHIPGLYQAALYNHDLHYVQHALLVPTAILTWWPVLSMVPESPRISPAAQLLYIFGLSLAQMAVFGLVTFADDVLYPAYAAAPRIWGITAHEDQQLSGIIMKVAGGGVSTIALTLIFFRWFARAEAADRAAETH